MRPVKPAAAALVLLVGLLAASVITAQVKTAAPTTSKKWERQHARQYKRGKCVCVCGGGRGTDEAGSIST